MCAMTWKLSTSTTLLANLRVRLDDYKFECIWTEASCALLLKVRVANCILYYTRLVSLGWPCGFGFTCMGHRHLRTVQLDLFRLDDMALILFSSEHSIDHT